MNDDQLPIKLDLKANIKVDSKDVTGCINKLIETIRDAFSWWAKGKEPIITAKADTKAALIRADAAAHLMKCLGITREEAFALTLRTEQRQSWQSIRQQLNMEAIAQGAVVMLPESVNEEPVDVDWSADFFEQCKNVSNEQMQSLWSKILAGEVARPGSFSRRTLSLVGRLSQDEANQFTKFCSLVWRGISGKMFAIRYEDFKRLETYGVTYGILLELDSLGLINLSRASFIEVNAPDKAFVYFDESHCFHPKDPARIFLRSRIMRLAPQM